MCFKIPQKVLNTSDNDFHFRQCKELKNVQNIEIKSALFDLPDKGLEISEEFSLAFKYSKRPTILLQIFALA